MGKVVCSKQEPIRKGKIIREEHPQGEFKDVVQFEEGEWFARFKCPHCGRTFYVKLR